MHVRRRFAHNHDGCSLPKISGAHPARLSQEECNTVQCTKRTPSTTTLAAAFLVGAGGLGVQQDQTISSNRRVQQGPPSPQPRRGVLDMEFCLS